MNECVCGRGGVGGGGGGGKGGWGGWGSLLLKQTYIYDHTNPHMVWIKLHC